MSGSNESNAPGVYGVEGVAATTNIPGARAVAVSWVDSSGNMWMFGGVWVFGGSNTGAADIAGTLNDLWKFTH